MKSAFPNLMKPMKLGSHILKNRMGMSRANPTFVVGSNSDLPLDTMVTFAGDRAREGAAIVTMPSPNWPWPEDHKKPMDQVQIRHSMADRPGEEADFRPPEPGEFKGINFELDNVKIMYARAAEAAHNEGALACMSMMEIEPFGWNIWDVPEQYLEEMIDKFVYAAKQYRACGYDIFCFYMTAGGCILGESLSPHFNTRTDRFGGKTMAERATLSLEIFRRVREACPGILIEAQVSGAEKVEGGYTTDDLIEYLRCVEDYVDIVQVRVPLDPSTGDTHLTINEGDEPQTIAYAAAIKKAGIRCAIAPTSGFHDPVKNEEYLAKGMADFFYICRPFFSDSELIRKIRENRVDEVIPCLRCNKCHARPGDADAGCCVNPQLILSLTDREHSRIEPAAVSRRVAVIGGGPAGMEAAIVAARRGHDVTLYEKTGVLGGQLIHADYFPFKWTLRNFKDTMIHLVDKAGVKVELNVTVTPEFLSDKGFDAIILAAGSEPNRLHIPGADQENVYTVMGVLGHEAELGERVVVTGGAENGVETALYLAEAGHQVTLLTRASRLAGDAQPIHYREYLMMRCWSHEPQLTYITRATIREIRPHSVVYTDRDGNEVEIPADSVVTSAGSTSRTEGFEAYSALTDSFWIVGDCRSVHDVRRAMKSAFSAAVRI